MSNTIKKIVLMSDILRISPKEKFYTDRSCKWLYNLFCKQINSSINIPLELELGCNSNLFNREVFYKLAGYKEVSEENYIEIAKGNINRAAFDYFRSCFDGYFIIFQEAGTLKQLADYAKIPYIDIIISSIRFLEDLNFAFRTNVPEIRNLLLKYREPEADLYMNANQIKAYYESRQNVQFLNNFLQKESLLLCGQTEVDLSLIKNKKLVSFLDYQEKTLNLCASYNHVYYKAHPYAKENTENEKFIDSIPNVTRINENFYKLMASDNIVAVAALSSGTVKEAKYFGKKSIFISHPFISYYYDDAKSINKNDFIIINNSYYSPTFWADILSPMFTTNKNHFFSFSSTKNRLRKSLNVWWGYEVGNENNSVHPPFPFLTKNLVIRKEEKFDNVSISSQDISVIVQGAVINKQDVKNCLNSVRKYLPKAEIILSTWDGCDISELDYDILVLNEDPGAADLSPVTDKKDNVNRQIVSTQNGLAHASRKYSLKIRTACSLTGIGFLKYYNKFSNMNLKREESYNYFKNRIMIDSYFTRNPENYQTSRLALNFHPSDVWHFGATEDLKTLFDIPLQEKFISTVNNIQYQWRVPEQYIWTTFLEKQGLSVPLDSMYFNVRYTRDLTIRSIINNFFILDHALSNIKFPSKFKTYPKSTFESIISTYAYFVFYQRKYDNDFKLPIKFKENIYDALGIKKYINELKKYLNDLKKILESFKIFYKLPLLIIKIFFKIVFSVYKLLWWVK